MKINRLLSATALVGILVSYPAIASAKTAPEGKVTAAADEKTATEEAPVAADDNSIVVTGTRINRPNIDSSIPITTVSAQELLGHGNISIGDLVNQLPQLRSSVNQANSQNAIGRAGISALDLRGLGTARTLVLLDGRRIVTATPGSNRPDVNLVPNDLVERLDIITGGNSAIYGSDAVAGVANFVLKQDFEGVKARAQGGISSRGDRGSYFGSLTAGHNFFDGRANLTFSFEYANSNTLTNADRDFTTGSFSGRNQFQTVENTGANLNPSAGALHGAEPSTGNGIPDTAFISGIRNNNISNGGLFTAACPTAAATGESAAAFAARRANACSGLPNPGSSNALAQFGTTYAFNPDGTLTPNTCITDFRPFGSSNCQGGRGSTLLESGFIIPGLERRSFHLQGHFEVSPAFDPYFQAQYLHVIANQEGQPTFFNNSFSINNPFLTTQARNTLVAALAPGATTFTAQRFDIDFGGRGEQHLREQLRAVVGVRGTFNDDWKYDVSFNYGNLYTYYETAGNINRQKYANSIDAQRNGAGQIVCGINNDASTANDDAACVPVNLFGDGQPSQAALNYFGYTSSRVQKANLYNVVGYVAGDSSQLFELPGGPVGFVIGGEYRRETAFAAYDSFTSGTSGIACPAAGCTFLNTIPDFVVPDQVVKEGFAEISLPLLKDLPFVHELTLDGAVRVSNYNLGNTGTVVAYNASGIYSPVEGVRFRAGYARAIRAPTQADLYAPQSQTFLNGLVDPCGQQNINNNPNRVANCRAAGVPTTQTFNGTTEPFSNRPASGISGSNGSNPLLKAETSNSLTIGAVIQPRFIPGLAISVDYYHIEITNAINSLAAQTIINQCYDSPGGINNPYCASIFRNANGTFRGQSDVSHGGTTVSLTPSGASFISGPFNYARNINSGIDADVSYRTNLTDNLKLSLRGILSKAFIKDNYTDINDPNFIIRQLNNLGDPEWQGTLSANLSTKVFNFGYRFRYYDKQTIGAYETQNSVQGRPPTNPDLYPVVYYPAITYSDLRLDITPPDTKFKFYLGVDNVFDQLGPYGLIGNENGNPFDAVGRFLYAGVEVRF
ncbi:TonB-dependent receptor domain-containing protein [Sphingomonas sp. 28-63-12]|uniref:TonB-dependent receptor domain-containing protein n=1 Tax=Sphingomonas sp. 28-63-12 TaxID=1970434 RepID=UPI000BD39FC4|nr:MAG: TonB-dependent receptor [Sphingomonas sp. 28-63-12]